MTTTDDKQPPKTIHGILEGIIQLREKEIAISQSREIILLTRKAMCAEHRLGREITNGDCYVAVDRVNRGGRIQQGYVKYDGNTFILDRNGLVGKKLR